ncbi:MAG: prepilin peptidase, partial [Candidatus Bathyarchaeota archaeon]|nr:prepilin peptidase [Candidatus Bathyarchaeota archaeon]
MIPLIQLEAGRVVLSVAMLGYASWSDLRTREVSDLTWVVFGALGLIIDIYEVATGDMKLLTLAVPVLLSTTLSFALAYLGLFGGADFKAFVALAILQPYPPRLIRPALGVVSVVYPLTIFSNSALAGASFGLVILVRNILAARRG